jgi:arylformamidase
MIDITVPLVPGRVPLYPGDTPLVVERAQERSESSPNVSKLVCSVHGGTHVDAPVHFLDTADGIESVPVDALIGPTWVVDARMVQASIDAVSLEGMSIPSDAERILFRTRNSELWNDPKFVADFVFLAPDAARVLVDRGLRLVGTDYLSIASYHDPAPTHEVLLRAGVVIVETLDLRSVEPGWYDLICLPLLIPGADGAPARALLTPQ